MLTEAVAGAGGRILGPVLFSAFDILRPHGGGLRAAALAPLAVLPGRQQQQSIGAALLRHGLTLCGDMGVPAAIFLGEPACYTRLGFGAAGLRTAFRGTAFMALELVPGALALGGTVRYATAFGLRS